MTLEVNALGTQSDTAVTETPPAADTAAAASAVSETQKAIRPEWLGEEYFDGDTGQIKFDDFGKHYGELLAKHKSEAERLAAYPQKVEDLTIEPVLGEGEKLPDGVTFDASNPLYAGFRQFVFDNKLDPKLAGTMLGMYAKSQVADVAAINARVDEESRKLGANGPARITAVQTALEGHIGKDLAGAVMAGVFRADQVQALEKVVLALANGGSANLSGNGHEQEPEPTLDRADRMFPTMRAKQ